jgi:hypothetical protein
MADYMATDSKIVVCKQLADSVEKLEMLRSYGFSCKYERHCGFWLIHYKFPKLKLVSGNAIAK